MLDTWARREGGNSFNGLYGEAPEGGGGGGGTAICGLYRYVPL